MSPPNTSTSRFYSGNIGFCEKYGMYGLVNTRYDIVTKYYLRGEGETPATTARPKSSLRVKSSYGLSWRIKVMINKI